MSRRYQDWATRLNAYVAENRDRPFSYDYTLGLDCCTFSWGAIHAMTGILIGIEFHGKYRTQRESLKTMRAYCGRPSLRMFTQRLMARFGFECILPGFAGRGDAIIAPQESGANFFGILLGRDVVSVGEHGLRRVPVSSECVAWKIR